MRVLPRGGETVSRSTPLIGPANAAGTGFSRSLDYRGAARGGDFSKPDANLSRCFPGAKFTRCGEELQPSLASRPRAKVISKIPEAQLLGNVMTCVVILARLETAAAIPPPMIVVGYEQA